MCHYVLYGTKVPLPSYASTVKTIECLSARWIYLGTNYAVPLVQIVKIKWDWRIVAFQQFIMIFVLGLCLHLLYYNSSAYIFVELFLHSPDFKIGHVLMNITIN